MSTGEIPSRKKVRLDVAVLCRAKFSYANLLESFMNSSYATNDSNEIEMYLYDISTPASENKRRGFHNKGRDISNIDNTTESEH